MSMTTCRLGVLAATVSIAAILVSDAARAQEQRWVQIEAHRTLDEALQRAGLIDERIGNVSGFRLPSEWYALSIGPFETEGDAFSVRRQLRAAGVIPADAFVSNGADYLAQFFPIDGSASALQAPVAEALVPQSPDAQTPDAPEIAIADPLSEPGPEPEETLREAQASERSLGRDDRAEIQTALQWFGFYTLGIDAAFGPGTRRAMEAWQADQGVDATGVLTTRQRAALVGAYQSELAALGMQTVRDEFAGISIDLPLALVQFEGHEAPFARFTERDASGVQVLLISQPGTQATLFGLYEIMQTLEIVPLEGRRERQQNSFVLTGKNADLRSHTIAQFRNGAVKGFTLVWTPDRDAQMERVLPMMEASFAAIDGVLPEGAGQASAVQRAALLAGLAVRRPEFSRSGFYVDATGTVLTTAAAVAQCDRVTIDEAYTARVVARDDALGLAVLQPETPLVPLAFAQFQERAATLGAEVTIAGFSFEDAMTRPVLTFGRIEDMRGLNGEDDRFRLSAEIRQGDLGGPVFGSNGAVIGLLAGQPSQENRVLPGDVNFAVPAEVIKAFLRSNNISSGTLREDVSVPPEVMTRISGDLTVLVSCWN